MYRFLIAILFNIFLVQSSLALTMSPTPVTELLSRSELVIHGRVQSSRIWLRPVQDDRAVREQFILYTLYQVEVYETFGVKSAVQIGDSVAVRLIGGVIDKDLRDQLKKIPRSKGSSVIITNEISFKTGEEVILFLNEEDDIYIPSYHKGVVRIVDGAIVPNPALTGMERAPLALGLEFLRVISHQLHRRLSRQ